MKKFESPEISVVMFSAQETVLTASTGGYEDNKNHGGWRIASNNIVDGSGDSMPL